MEPKDDFEVVDHLTSPTGTSFSQLLFGDDDEDANNALAAFAVDHTYDYNLTHHLHHHQHSPPVFSIDKAPKMLCFGTYHTDGELFLPETNSTPQKSVITSSDSSSASSCNQSTTGINSLSKPNSMQKKRNGLGQQPVTKAGDGAQRAPKKTKAENPNSTGHAKRKEKLGERIATLQQLVSPFGKTDTASVLHEAMGYIRFLHDQVHVLCSPYLQRLPSSTNQLQHQQLQHQHQHLPGDGDNNGDEELEEEDDNKDLRSRGLCLVPVECTDHVASTNGADFWSPAAIGNNSNNVSAMQ